MGTAMENATKQNKALQVRRGCHICNFARRDAMVQHYGNDLDIFRWRGMYMGVSLFVAYSLL